MKKKHRFIRGLLRFIIALFFLGMIIGGGFVAYTASKAPKLSSVNVTPSAFRTQVLDNQEKQIRILAGEGANRVYADIGQIPDDLEHAFVAIEDERFYQHKGVDIRGILRAVYKGITRGGLTEGASTITQQLLKNNVLVGWTEEKSFYDKLTRKIQEQYLAIQLEREQSKDWILENYLNTINLGSGCWGVQAASMQYFQKDVADLTLSECAVLAGITKNPSRYSPLKDAEACRTRQQLVLSDMLEQEYITREQYETAVNDNVFERIALIGANEKQSAILSYFEDALLNQLVEDLQSQQGYSEEQAWQLLYRGGLTIYSTQDTQLMNLAQQAMLEDENFPEGVQSSLVMMDPRTGAVCAIIGGRGEKNASLVFNRALSAVRQPGSTFKITGEYALALEKGDATLATAIDDAPYSYADGKELKNASGKFAGRITLRDAIIDSKNIPAVKLLDQQGVDAVWQMQREFGFAHLTEDDKVQALALGGTYNGVTNLELTAAYSAIAADGVYRTPHFYTKVTDQDGKVILTAQVEEKQVISDDTAALLTLAMEDVMTKGTGKKAAFEHMSLAGKTGTTTSRKDLWMVGFSPYYVCGIWGGYDSNDEQDDSDYVKLLWKQVMSQAHEGLDDVGFALENGLTRCEICRKCGMKAVKGLCDSSDQGDQIRTEYFAAGTAPASECTCHEKVRICKESQLPAGSYCPTAGIVEKVYLKEGTAGTADEKYVKPKNFSEETCTTHVHFWDGWFGDDSSEQETDPLTPSPEDGSSDDQQEYVPELPDNPGMPPNYGGDSNTPGSTDFWGNFFDLFS